MKVNIGDLVLVNKSEELKFYIVRNIRSVRLKQYRGLNMKKFDINNFYITELINESDIIKHFEFDKLEWKEAINEVFKDHSEEDKLRRIAELEKILSIEIESFSDYINYSSLQTTDECLDAMNDLTDLHNSFKDERYLEDREKVIDRLETLVEIDRMSKSIAETLKNANDYFFDGFDKFGG